MKRAIALAVVPLAVVAFGGCELLTGIHEREAVTTDPSGAAQIPIRAYEHFEANEDATHAGTCTPYDFGMASLGAVTMASDPALANLALPLRLK